MRKLIAAGAVCAAAFGAVTTAHAGPETQDANGNYVVYDADFAPPATGKGVKVTSANFAVSFGNKKSGSPFPRIEKLNLTMPSGTKYNGLKLTQCEANADGTLDCGKDDEVGDGTAAIDGRALGLQDPITATITAYNGPKRGGKPTLVLIAKATVNGMPIESQINFQWTGRAFELFFTNSNRIAYSFSSLQLRLGAYAKGKVPGHKAVITSLIQPPKTCPARGWNFTLTEADPAGNAITAGDFQPCVRLR